MSSFIRQLSFGLLCGGIAFAVAGCSSEEAGKTLTVEFSSSPVLVMSLTEVGSDETASEAAKPDIYTGATTVVAKVVYRNPQTTALVYKWTYSLPSGITAVETTDDETLTLDASVSKPHGVPQSAGVGSVKLEVYERSGTQFESATTSLTVLIGYSG